MFICGDCGGLFEETVHFTERHGQDTPPYEELDGCPYCYGVCILEAHVCNECGGYVAGELVRTVRGMRICLDCYLRHDDEEDDEA